MFQLRGLYGVLDLTESDDVVARAELLAGKLLAGGACILQVRMKGASAAAMLAVARAARVMCTRAGVPLVVNDRLDVAMAVAADGVHLGQDDLPIAAARAALAAAGRTMIIGVSTHDPVQAAAAARAGADYLGFGPVYATRTKENPDPVQGIAALAIAVEAAAPVPIVAIGGITPARALEVASAGAVAACAISSVNDAPDVIAAARAVVAAFR